MRFILSLLLMGWLSNANAQESAGVMRVIDGDTFEMMCRGQKLRCRLANVDAPEKDQFFGQAVKDSINNWLLGKECEITIIKKDMYGRYIVELIYQGVPVYETLVAKGWAWHYEKYSYHKARLAALQLAAQAQHLGLWVCDKNIPPEVFRKLNYKNKRLYEVCQ